MIRRLWRTLLGPDLFRIYGDEAKSSHSYKENIFETISGSLIKWISFCWRYSTWFSPFVGIVLYRKNMFNLEGLRPIIVYSISFSVLFVSLVIIRAFGRICNKDYSIFIEEFENFKRFPCPETKRKILKYDFSFSYWPIEFKASKISKQKTYEFASPPKNQVLVILSKLCVKSFGIRLLYPGTVSFLQSFLSEVLMNGREKLIKENNGIRVKLLSSAGNEVDIMVVDSRNKKPNGNTLIICSEGNAGFYEIGCMNTPLELDYSVIGWNHPGFSGSTGLPMPEQEQASIDAVIQYAINVLGFPPHEIIFFAWSIGGYAASWAASTYPDAKSVILDATFDHILPLALAKMPPSWKPLIELAMPLHLNLNNSQLLTKYPGKITLVRRTKDEMISTSNPPDVSSNRANDLLIDILTYRYPELVNDSSLQTLMTWLAISRVDQEFVQDNIKLPEDLLAELKKPLEPIIFPREFGKDLSEEMKEKSLIYIAKKYLLEYDSTHCTPLPSSFLSQPSFLV